MRADTSRARAWPVDVRRALTASTAAAAGLLAIPLVVWHGKTAGTWMLLCALAGGGLSLTSVVGKGRVVGRMLGLFALLLSLFVLILSYAAFEIYG